jgi:hypothetical protein
LFQTHIHSVLTLEENILNLKRENLLCTPRKFVEQEASNIAQCHASIQLHSMVAAPPEHYCKHPAIMGLQHFSDLYVE